LSKGVIPFFSTLIKLLIIIIALGFIFSIWKIDLTPLLASAGIISAIIALAARDTIANFFGGISIFIDKPYKIGDYIDLDSKERGEVIAIGVRSTRINTRDDVEISIPNSIIANTKIINESAPVANFRVRIPFIVAYGTDVDLMEKTVLELTSNNTNVIKEPAPRLRLRKFGESGLEYELLCWAIDPAQRGLTIHEICTAIYKKFHELKIVIPYPQRVLHVIGDHLMGG
jgi:MscS family membrane protein